MKTNNFIVLVIIIFFLVFCAYSNHFNNPFHFDDSHVIENNAFIKSIKNIPRFFSDVQTHSSISTNQVYRPILISLFSLEYLFAKGLNPFVFHVFGFTFYVLLGFLIFLFILKIFNRVSPHSRNYYLALFATGWYLLSPINTETVNYIFQQSEIIVALGVLASFTLYIFKPKWRKSYLYLLPMAIASFAKISSLIFIPLLFVYILLFEKNCSLIKFFQKSFWLSVWQTLKQIFPGLIISIFLFVFIQSMDAPTVVLSITSRGDYLMSQPFALLYYLSSFFLPVNLSADHGWVSALYVFDGWFILGIILLIFIIHLAVKFSKNIETRPISFGLLWFLIALLPSSSIFPLAEVVNDHRPFLAYIGLVLAIVWGFYLIFKNKKLAFLKPSKTTIIFLASAILVTSALGTYNRNKVWHTSESLWYDVVQKNPQHARGLMNYALSQMQKGRLETAQYYLEKAAPLAPLYPYLKINLAIVKEYLGNPQDAETYFKQALILGPNHQETLYCYADFLNRQGRKPEAIKMLYRLLKTSPSYLKTYYLLMDIYSHQHDIIHLSEIAEKILKIIPNDPTTLQYLAKTQDLNVELEKARIQVEENPTVENLFYFGFLNIQAKNFEQAIELNKQVIELEPNYIQAYNNLGTCYNHLGKWKQAIETFQKALAIDPNYNLVQDNLNYALEQQKLTKSE